MTSRFCTHSCRIPMPAPLQMSEPVVEPVLKRKRVAVACDSCRTKKAKCDGKRPACGRCVGYGYACLWGNNSIRTRTQTPEAVDGPRETFVRYQDLVRRLCVPLGQDARDKVEENLAELRTHVGNALLLSSSMASSTTAPSSQVIESHMPPVNSQRYLGEVSDVYFFNLVRRALGGCNDREAIECYDQDEAPPKRQIDEFLLQHVPKAEDADRYIDVYFSTIHVAYPFIPKSSFYSTYRALRSGHLDSRHDPPWMFLFSIGGYYALFPGDDPSKQFLHKELFERSLQLCDLEKSGRCVYHVSLSHIFALLAQCFYLLAICRTDRCWTTLGIAIRLGQSIGLHVETPSCNISPAKAEIRRRTWYSLYVLDRLVALQLGRPPAISDADCHVSLPSRMDDSDYDWDKDGPLSTPGDEATAGDYFLHVIELSSITGRVLRDIYNPRRQVIQELDMTRNLDRRLLEWKQQLPRTLRFDIGHAFQKSITFKRQRNMLAIKFHHLRALIHRPYLCLPMLKGPEGVPEPILDSQYDTLQHYERVCISEAQETAHLLHHVVDEKDLVHDFPFWQMISCLICASSILVVARAFAKRDPNDDLDTTVLDEDAETCLTVFEALSRNSEGARIARDMMKKLRERSSVLSNDDDRIQPSSSSRPHTLQQHQQRSNDLGGATLAVAAAHSHPMSPDSQTGAAYHVGPAAAAASVAEHEPLAFSGNMVVPTDLMPETYFLGPNNWPLEISDSMAWSAQFFEVQTHQEEEQHEE